MTERRWRVGIWCAVSSKPQAAEDKSSLQDQEAAGHRFAATVGEAVAVYRVPGHSRTMWRWEDAEAAMPAYRQLREDVEAGRIDVLWCLEPSRLGRDTALVQQVNSLLAAHGAEVYRADAPHEIGQKSTSHRFLDAFGAVMAEQESEVRVARHRAGMRGRVKRGLFASAPPYGYRVVHDSQGKVSGYEQTDGADAIRHMTRLFLEGHSLNEIRRRMDESGHRPPQSQHWSRYTVRRLLWTDAFAGYPAWGGASYQGAEPSPFYEPIWSAETYRAVIQERERRRSSPYTHRNSGPLRGVAVCARCGYKMVRASNGQGNYYLRCNTHHRRRSTPHLPECHANYCPEPQAIAVLSEYIRALGTEDTLDRILERRQDQQQADESANELDRLRHQLASLDSQRERLALAFAGGDMALAYYRRADDALAAQQDTAQRRVVELERYLESLPDWDARRDQLRWLFQNFDALIERAEPPLMSKALQEAGFSLMIEDGNAWVMWA